MINLAEGASYEDEFNVASNNDLSQGDEVTNHSEGYVNLVALPYYSKEITIKIDANEAKTSPKPVSWTKTNNHYLSALLSRLYQRQHQYYCTDPWPEQGSCKQKLSRLCVGSVQHGPKL